MSSYRDLKVWQTGIDITLEIYKLTKDFPQHEIYGLTSQLRRAAVSIPSNVTEGQARKSDKELARFLGIAKGSLAEIETQIIIATELDYITQEKANAVLKLTEMESRMLSGLINSVRK